MRWFGGWVSIALSGAACGTPTALETDAAPGHDGPGVVDAAVDGMPTNDGALDATPPDAAGMFVPDPPDPASLPCTGRLGFPNLASPSSGDQLTVVDDVDGDGILDLASRGFDRIDIMLGIGDGRFQPPISHPMPTNFGAFRFVDLDRDGHRDLVFARQKTLQIKLADGIGGFGPAQVLDAARPMDRVEVADLDGDQDLDLVGLSSTQIVVFLATASGFAAAQPYEIAKEPVFSFQVGDLTGDGRPDVVATVSQKMNLLVNRGDGSFAPSVGVPVALSPWGIALGDLDEDGMLDVVLGTSNADVHAQVSVLRNNGGTFGAAVPFEVTSSLSQSPRDLEIADFDQDGHLDVVAVDAGLRQAEILRGTGTGALEGPIDVTAGRVIMHAQIGDLDGNGRPDLVLWDTAITTYLNDGSPDLFEGPVRHAFSTIARIKGARVIDLDEDGNLDLVALGELQDLSGIVATRLGTGPGTFAPNDVAYASAALGIRIVLADMNNDGRRDIVLGGDRGMVFLNRGDGTLAGAAPYDASPSGRVTSIAPGDLDGDGFRDLVIGLDLGNFSTRVVSLRGLGNGTFSAPEPLWSSHYVAGAATADLDGDGQLDVVIDDYVTTARRLVMRGLGGGMLAPPVVTTLPALGAAPFARDLDGDGHLDLISFSNTAFIVTRGAGDGTLASPVTGPARANSLSPAFADLDGDGNLDVVTGEGSLVGVLLGRGDGTFAPIQMFDAGANLRAISAADVDADGRVDLVVDSDFNEVTVLPGRCL